MRISDWSSDVCSSDLTTVPVQLGADGHLSGWPVLVFVLGLVLTVALWVRKVRGAILIGIIAASVLAIVVEAVGNLGAAGAKNPGGWALSIPKLDGGVFEAPDFSTLGEFNQLGSASWRERVCQYVYISVGAV